MPMWTPQAAPPASGLVAPSPSWTPNPSDAAANLTVSGFSITGATGGSYKTVRGTVSRSSGIWMWSFWPDPAGGEWVNGNDFVGLANASQSLTTYLGSAGNNSVGLRTGGTPIFSDGNLSAVNPYRAGSRVDIALVFSSSKIYFRTNEGLWNATVGATPATDTGGLSVSGLTGPLFPAVCLNNNGLICHTESLPFDLSGASAPAG